MVGTAILFMIAWPCVVYRNRAGITGLWESYNGETLGVGLVLVSVMCWVIAVCVIGENITQFLMVWVAPKLYVLDYLSTL